MTTTTALFNIVLFTKLQLDRITLRFVMVALCNRADHYIFALWFLSIHFFPCLISAAADRMSTTLPHMVWP